MKTIKNHKNKVITFLSFMAVAAFTIITLSLTSCQKDPQPTPQAKEITVQVQTAGLHITELKSFDLSQWQYNYNPNAYELTFTGSKGKVYTFSKTIQELKAGFAISVMPDNYTITYASWHTPANGNTYLSETLDITINESKNISTPTDLTLQAVPDDYCVIMNNNCNYASLNVFNGWNPFFNSPDGTFKYMYYNQERDLEIKWQDATSGNVYTKTIANALKGNVYHVVNAVNGNSGINIIGMNYNLLGW